MKRFRCECPCGCDYETDIKAHINFHHIQPREKNGSDKNWNKISLCPTCHNAHIYISDSDKAHSIKGEVSFELIGWKMSSSGRILEYYDKDGEICFYQRKD